jgi:hypothetical protein
MGTSKSSSDATCWQGRAWIFSGRPDPAWSVCDEVAHRLEEIWGELEPVSDVPSVAPPLGYRGCSISDLQGRSWYAYGGKVLLKAGARSETRCDPERQFEKTVLESAPAEVVPAHFLGFL